MRDTTILGQGTLPRFGTAQGPESVTRAGIVSSSLRSGRSAGKTSLDHRTTAWNPAHLPWQHVRPGQATGVARHRQTQSRDSAEASVAVQ